MSIFARLVALLFLLGLLASRAGVVLHELAGHYGVARLFGCSLTELRLFLFGGGFVDYACPPLTPAQHLATDLGGIAVQVAAGFALALGATRLRGVAALVAASAAALFVLHGLFYLVTGVHYGVGDGRSLHVGLGAGRRVPVAIGSAILVALGYFAARALARRLAPWIPTGRTSRRLAWTGAAVLAAAILHAAAFTAEQRILADATYAETFRPQATVEVEQTLSRIERERPLPPDEIAATRRRLEAQSAPFPLRPWLVAALGAAVLAGLATSLRRDTEMTLSPARDALPAVIALCVLAQLVVIALDRWL